VQWPTEARTGVVEEKEIPRIEIPTMPLSGVSLAAICGTGLHLDDPMMPATRVEMTFGHEFNATT
jgi:threonine dehydrogenase-like Zn-dependent dehydrogenase